jgi:hypothetical protein
MATVTRSSNYPSALDTTSNLPSVANGGKTDATQTNALRDAIIQLEAMAGATTPASGSLRFRVAALENYTTGGAGTAGGDISGAFTNMQVNYLQSQFLTTLGALDGYVITYSTTRHRWEPQAPTATATGTLDRALFATDHSPFSETGTSFAIKKYRDIVKDSNKAFTKLRAVLGLWREGGSAGNTVEAQISLGAYTATVSTSSSTEYVCSVEVTAAYLTANTMSTVYVSLRKVDSGITAAHLRYSDIFAVYE